MSRLSEFVTAAMNPSGFSCAGNSSKSSAGRVETKSLCESLVDDMTLEGGVRRRSSASDVGDDVIGGGVSGRGVGTDIHVLVDINGCVT